MLQDTHLFFVKSLDVRMKMYAKMPPNILQKLRLMSPVDRIAADLALFSLWDDEAIKYQVILLQQWCDKPATFFQEYFLGQLNLFSSYLSLSMQKNISNPQHRLLGSVVLKAIHHSPSLIEEEMVSSLINKWNEEPISIAALECLPALISTKFIKNNNEFNHAIKKLIEECNNRSGNHSDAASKSLLTIIQGLSDQVLLDEIADMMLALLKRHPVIAIQGLLIVGKRLEDKSKLASIASVILNKLNDYNKEDSSVGIIVLKSLPDIIHFQQSEKSMKDTVIQFINKLDERRSGLYMISDAVLKVLPRMVKSLENKPKLIEMIVDKLLEKINLLDEDIPSRAISALSRIVGLINNQDKVLEIILKTKEKLNDNSSWVFIRVEHDLPLMVAGIKSEEHFAILTAEFLEDLQSPTSLYKHRTAAISLANIIRVSKNENLLADFIVLLSNGLESDINSMGEYWLQCLPIIASLVSDQAVIKKWIDKLIEIRKEKYFPYNDEVFSALLPMVKQGATEEQKTTIINAIIEQMTKKTKDFDSILLYLIEMVPSLRNQDQLASLFNIILTRLGEKNEYTDFYKRYLKCLQSIIHTMSLPAIQQAILELSEQLQLNGNQVRTHIVKCLHLMVYRIKDESQLGSLADLMTKQIKNSFVDIEVTNCLVSMMRYIKSQDKRVAIASLIMDSLHSDKDMRSAMLKLKQLPSMSAILANDNFLLNIITEVEKYLSGPYYWAVKEATSCLSELVSQIADDDILLKWLGDIMFKLDDQNPNIQKAILSVLTAVIDRLDPAFFATFGVKISAQLNNVDMDVRQAGFNFVSLLMVLDKNHYLEVDQPIDFSMEKFMLDSIKLFRADRVNFPSLS